MVVNALVLSGRSAVAEAARSGDEDELVTVLDGLKDRAPSRNALRDAAEVLRSTGSRRVRNTAALALADSGLVEMCEPLIEVLRDERIAGEAGTLLFALDELGGALPLDVAVRLIAKGSYEARAETLIFFEERRIDHCGEEAREAAMATLTALMSSQDAEAAEAAELALAFLDGNG